MTEVGSKWASVGSGRSATRRYPVLSRPGAPGTTRNPRSCSTDAASVGVSVPVPRSADPGATVVAMSASMGTIVVVGGTPCQCRRACPSRDPRQARTPLGDVMGSIVGYRGAMSEALSILLVGESWFTYSVHQK